MTTAVCHMCVCYNVMRGQATHPASMLSGTAKLMNLHELRIQKQETMTNTHTLTKVPYSVK